MEYILAMPVAVCGVLAAYCTLDGKLADRIRLLHIMGTPSGKSRDIGRRQVILLSLFIGMLCYGSAVKIFLCQGETVNRFKMLVALLCIAGAACNDYREQRIPNIFPLVMAVSGIICLAAGYLTAQNGAVSYVASSLIATVLVASCMTIAALLTRNGIGTGDIKLCSSLALIGGVYTTGRTLFWGMIACSLTAIFLLLSKKKTIQESLPFGPFVLIGYMISILV